MNLRLELCLVFVLAVGACEGTASGPSRTPEDDAMVSRTDATPRPDGSGPDADVQTDATVDASVDAVIDAMPIGSQGCIDGAGMDEGEITFMQDGMERKYVLHLPNGYTRDRSWPLLFALHGNGGNTGYWNGTSGSRNVRGEVEDDAILVVAEAIGNAWRDYGADASTWPARIEMELGYFDAIVDTLTTNLCVNEDAIFTMGFSGGGSFSGLLGCRRDYIRAFAAGGSVIYFQEDNCIQSPPAWITIRTQELTNDHEAFRD
ncbi:MAG: hypothetical protein AAGF12_38215, partial [Myxococcota bacterium]